MVAIFKIAVDHELVLVHGFEGIPRQFAFCDRELPELKEAMNRLVDQGYVGFVFDLRSADPLATYPIVKWGAMYGVASSLRRRFAAEPTCSISTAQRALNSVKLIFHESQAQELHIYKMTEIFQSFATVEEAKRALRASEKG